MSAPANPVVDGPVLEAVRRIGAAVEKARLVDLWRAGDRELLAAAVQAQALQDLLAGVALGLVAEVEVRGSALATGAPSTAAWLRAEARRQTREAQRLVTLATTLRKTRRITAEALGDGRITLARAQDVVRYLRQVPGTVPTDQVDKAEGVLVEHAQTMTDREFHIVAGHLLSALDPDGITAFEAQERRNREARELHLMAQPDESVLVRGRLDAVDGAWGAGGDTSVDNTILPCGHHHRVLHDPASGWAVTANPGGRPTWHPPPTTNLRP